MPSRKKLQGRLRRTRIADLAANPDAQIVKITPLEELASRLSDAVTEESSERMRTYHGQLSEAVLRKGCLACGSSRQLMSIKLYGQRNAETPLTNSWGSPIDRRITLPGRVSGIKAFLCIECLKSSGAHQLLELLLEAGYSKISVKSMTCRCLCDYDLETFTHDVRNKRGSDVLRELSRCSMMVGAKSAFK